MESYVRIIVVSQLVAKWTTNGRMDGRHGCCYITSINQLPFHSFVFYFASKFINLRNFFWKIAFSHIKIKIFQGQRSNKEIPLQLSNWYKLNLLRLFSTSNNRISLTYDLRLMFGRQLAFRLFYVKFLKLRMKTLNYHT